MSNKRSKIVWSGLRYFTRMSFLTDLTPSTPLATFTAVDSLLAELTKPLSWTMPLNVSTLISADLSVDSLRMAAFTLVVMTVSSTYSPVPACLVVEAQPNALAMRRIPTADASLRVMLVMIVPYVNPQACGDGSRLPARSRGVCSLAYGSGLRLVPGSVMFASERTRSRFACYFLHSHEIVL